MFRLAKKRLSQDPMLYHPDPKKPWIIKMDASKMALAGILLQPYDIAEPVLLHPLEKNVSISVVLRAT